jgi:hypothetical protein
MNIFFAILATLHFVYVWYRVLNFLKDYYLDVKSPNQQINELSTMQRWGIAGSYFLIDIIYPISAWILLNSFLNNKLLVQVSEDLKRDCGEEEYERTKRTVEKEYHKYLVYFVCHVIALLTWLYSKKYPLFDVFFWSITFGVPHALNPILLTVVITRIFKFSSARIDYFRQKFNEGHYKTCSMLWDDFIQLRNEIERYGDELVNPLGFFLGALLLSIVCQGVAVIIFKGEMFSIVYFFLNAYCLFSVIYGAVKVIKSFNDCCDDIIHSRTTSAVGEIGGLERQNINTVLSREDFSPAFRAFVLDLNSAQLMQAISVSALSVLSILWETFNFRDFFLGNTQKPSNNMDEYIRNLTENVGNLTALFQEKASQTLE